MKRICLENVGSTKNFQKRTLVLLDDASSFAEGFFHDEPCVWVRYRSGQKADAVRETLEEIEELIRQQGE